MRQHLVAGCGHLGTGHSSLTGLRPDPGACCRPTLTVPWASLGGGGDRELLGSPQGQEQVSLWASLGPPQPASHLFHSPLSPSSTRPPTWVPAWGTGGACPLCPAGPSHTR